MRRMNIFLVIISNVFASEQKKCGKNIAEVCDHQAENVQVKIEEEKHDKNTPNFSKPDSEVSEEVQQNECTKSCVQLCESTIANVMVKIEEDEGVKKQTSSKYFGVNWNKLKEKWKVRRWSKTQGKNLCNGSFNYDEEAKAAHASDTLARNLMNQFEESHKLNFPNDDTEVWAKEKEPSSKYLGVSWCKRKGKWKVTRWSKAQGTNVCNGTFNYEEETKAAHASDTLARKLMKKGEEGHKWNFPNDDTDVWAKEKETSSKYLGVSWNKNHEKWKVTRWSKDQDKNLCNGTFNRDEEKKAAHASDTLARKLMNEGEEGHKLNFPNDDTEAWAEKNKKRKRTDRLEPQND